MIKKQIITSLFPFLIVVLMFVVTLVLFYPGGMSGDSLGQWRQTIIWNIGGWHPPSMLYMWKLWSYIFYGPFAMLFFHSLTYWAAIFLIVTTLFQSIWLRSIIVILLGIFPPIWVLIGTVWKDTGLLVSFLMSIAIILFVDQFKKNKLYLFLALFFIAYGSSVRHNALLAIFPILILLTYVVLPNLNKIINLCVSALVVFVIGIAISQFNTKMVDERLYNVENSIFFWDLWGMSIDQNKNLMPNYLFKRNLKEHRSIDITLDELKEHYDPHCNTVIWPTSTGLRGDRWYEMFPAKKFREDFLSSIIEYPDSYIKVRTRAIKCLLSITCDNASSGAFLHIARFNPGHYLYDYSRQLKTGNFIRYPRYYHDITRNFFFKGWFYLLGCFVVFFISFCLIIYSNNPKRPFYAAMVSFSGLLYWIPYLVVAPCSDFRYNAWMIMSFLLSVMLLIRYAIENLKKLSKKEHSNTFQNSGSPPET